jgi:hypothetical protein
MMQLFFVQNLAVILRYSLQFQGVMHVLISGTLIIEKFQLFILLFSV